MNAIIKRITVASLFLVTLSAPLFSSAPKFGGEGFEVYINNKLVLQRFGNQIDVVKTISLGQYSPGDQITIKYYHCGRVGKSRTLVVKDENNKVLKQWKYNDVAEPVAGMNCTMKDIISLENTSSVLNLYYSSSELPGGRLLASFTIANSNARKTTP